MLVEDSLSESALLSERSQQSAPTKGLQESGPTLFRYLPCFGRDSCLVLHSPFTHFPSVYGPLANESISRVWFALVAALLRRLAPRRTTNGLHQIVTNWRKPSDSISLLSPWPADFSQDVVPVPCHSHNDYMRSIPLFDALAAGCESVEADLWLRNDTDRDLDLLVGHTSSSLTAQRTLRSLYLDPLIAILQNQSALLKTRRDGPQGLASGVFQMFPNTTLILLLDFKSNGTELWPVVSQQLEPLRQGGWLTSWNSSSNSTTWGPIRVVGSGNTPFDAIVANTTYRDIFFDVPLEDVANPQYDTSNSYLASISIQSAVGKMWNGKFSSKQLETIRYQISQARGKGLVPRYWDTVSWPVSWRNYVWSTLVDNDTGLLNVDDLQEASRWDWSWCIVAGLVLCGY